MARKRLKTSVPVQASIPLGRWFGIPVGADFSWAIMFLLITLSLANRYASEHPEWSSAQHSGLGVLTSVLFFVSIILHELGHSLVAVRLGVPVRSITLFIFGGVAMLEKEPERPRDEALIALAGPAVSLALSVVFGLITMTTGTQSFIGASASWIAMINGSLFLFNLVPGFPLDGGRVLRAILWGLKKDFTLATRWASRAGELVAYTLLGWGVFMALFQDRFFNGLWIGFIGWFLLNAARSSAAQVLVQEVLSKIPVADAMDTTCEVISPASPLEEIVETGVLRQGQRCFLVGSNDELKGLLTIHEIIAVAKDEWPVTSVQSVMIGLEGLETVSPETGLFEALRKMDGAGVNQIPVLQDGRLLGVLTRERLLGVMRNQIELKR